MKDAASLAFTQEQDKSIVPPELDTMASSTLLEEAYKEMHTRIQDASDRDLQWKEALLDKLDEVLLKDITAHLQYLRDPRLLGFLETF